MDGLAKVFSEHKSDQFVRRLWRVRFVENTSLSLLGPTAPQLNGE